jgi:hypothetical protein
MRIGQLADRFDGAGDRLSAGAAALADADPGAGAFGADAPGRLGAVGRLLHVRWSAALTSRAREAAAHGARLAAVADGLRTAAGRYQEAEDAAHGRHERSGGWAGVA